MRIALIGLISVVVLLGAAALASYVNGNFARWRRNRKQNLAPYRVHAIPSPNGGTNIVIHKGQKKVQTYKYVRGNQDPVAREAEVAEAIAAAELEAEDWNRTVKRDSILRPWKSLGTSL